MKSQGTKETQGINGDAAALQRQQDAALAALGAGEMQPCPYKSHRARGLDWANDADRVICGYCHPQPAERERQRAVAALAFEMTQPTKEAMDT